MRVWEDGSGSGDEELRATKSNKPKLPSARSFADGKYETSVLMGLISYKLDIPTSCLNNNSNYNSRMNIRKHIKIQPYKGYKTSEPSSYKDMGGDQSQSSRLSL